MIVGLAADHAGFDLRVELLEWLRGQGHQVLELGATALDPSDDYPDPAEAVAEAVASGRVERGIVLCGSGVGASIAANKLRGVRAAVCHDTYSARQGVEHDDMNVLCMGQRVVGPALAREVAAAFLGARFSGEERHLRRLRKLLAMEERSMGGLAGRGQGGGR